MDTHDLRMHSFHNSTLTFFVCTKGNLYCSHLSQCQMKFLQNVFNKVLLISYFKAIYYSNYSNCFQVSTTEAVQSETINLGDKTASVLVWKYFPLTLDISLAQSENASKQSEWFWIEFGRSGGLCGHFKLNWSNTKGDLFLLYSFSFSDVFHHSKQNGLRDGNHCGMDMATNTRKGLKSHFNNKYHNA